MSVCSQSEAFNVNDTHEADNLSNKVLQRLGVDVRHALSVESHKKATVYMLRLRDILLRGSRLSQNSKMSLLCAGANCARRIVCETDESSYIKLLKTTQSLVFFLISLSDGQVQVDRECAGDDTNIEDSDEDMLVKRPRKSMRHNEQMILAWKSKSLAEKISPETTPDSSWSRDIQSDVIVSRAALEEVRFIVGRDMSKLYDLSCTFFRCSASAIASSMLANSAPVIQDESSFLTLDTVSMMNDANEYHSDKLSAISEAAESESGQAIFRDMIMSFKLPQCVVGTRSTICFSRATNTVATKQHASVVNGAHDAAMRGSAWSYINDGDEIHKISALLAGYALIVADKNMDVRKSNAFGGRVCLPFFESISPPPHIPRLLLLHESNEWVVFSMLPNGQPKVKCRKSGFSGFCECLLLISKF